VVSDDRRDSGATNALVQTLASFGRKPALAVVSQAPAIYTGRVADTLATGRALLAGLFKRRRQPAPDPAQRQV